MTTDQTGLWRRSDFVKLWGSQGGSQAVSQLGSQITMLALPLLAVLGLGATSAQMAVEGG